MKLRWIFVLLFLMKLQVAKSSEPVFLASFPVAPRKLNDLKFDVYEPIQESMFKKRRVVVAETEKIEYVSTELKDSYCKYAIGVVDKSTGIVTLHEATPVSMTNYVKSLKPAESSLISEKNAAARNQLGQAFGTKKRRQAIKALELNQVGVSGLQDVDMIKETIASNVESLPKAEELLAQMMEDRLIPPCNPTVILNN